MSVFSLPLELRSEADTVDVRRAGDVCILLKPATSLRTKERYATYITASRLY